VTPRLVIAENGKMPAGDLSAFRRWPAETLHEPFGRQRATPSDPERISSIEPQCQTHAFCPLRLGAPLPFRKAALDQRP
jgi:hypothetical protein